MNLTKEERLEFKTLCSKYEIINIWDTPEALRAMKFLDEFHPSILIGISEELSDENPNFIGMKHGHISTYTNGRCHHTLCKYSNTLYNRIKRKYPESYWNAVDRCLESLIEAHQIGMPKRRGKNEN